MSSPHTQSSFLHQLLQFESIEKEGGSRNTCSLFLWSRFPRKANVPTLYWEVRHREAKVRERGESHRRRGTKCERMFDQTGYSFVTNTATACFQEKSYELLYLRIVQMGGEGEQFICQFPPLIDLSLLHRH